MDEALKTAVASVVDRFGVEVQEFRGEVTLLLPAPAEKIIPLLQMLNQEEGFNFLIDITAVDYWPQEAPRFHIVYHILRQKDNQVLCLRAALDGNSPTIPTAEKIWPNANWYEREVWDMFGVRFEGHSDMRRIVMPYEWEGHPLRKDYPLGYEEVQFSFNQAEIRAKKPHPQQ